MLQVECLPRGLRPAALRYEKAIAAEIFSASELRLYARFLPAHYPAADVERALSAIVQEASAARNALWDAAQDFPDARGERIKHELCDPIDGEFHRT